MDPLDIDIASFHLGDYRNRKIQAHLDAEAAQPDSAALLSELESAWEPESNLAPAKPFMQDPPFYAEAFEHWGKPLLRLARLGDWTAFEAALSHGISRLPPRALFGLCELGAYWIAAIPALAPAELQGAVIEKFLGPLLACAPRRMAQSEFHAHSTPAILVAAMAKSLSRIAPADRDAMAKAASAMEPLGAWAELDAQGNPLHNRLHCSSESLSHFLALASTMGTDPLVFDSALRRAHELLSSASSARANPFYGTFFSRILSCEHHGFTVASKEARRTASALDPRWLGCAEAFLAWALEVDMADNPEVDAPSRLISMAELSAHPRLAAPLSKLMAKWIPDGRWLLGRSNRDDKWIDLFDLHFGKNPVLESVGGEVSMSLAEAALFRGSREACEALATLGSPVDPRRIHSIAKAVELDIQSDHAAAAAAEPWHERSLRLARYAQAQCEALLIDQELETNGPEARARSFRI